MSELQSSKITVKEFLFLSASKYEPLQLISYEEEDEELLEVLQFFFNFKLMLLLIFFKLEGGQQFKFREFSSFGS